MSVRPSTTQLVVGKECAVEEHQIDTGKASLEYGIDSRTGRDIAEPPPAPGLDDRDADGVAFHRAQMGPGGLILEVERDLARDREGFDGQSQGLAVIFEGQATASWSIAVERQGHAIDNIGGKNIEDAVGSQRRVNARGGVEIKRLALAQCQQSGHRVDIAVREHDRADRRVTFWAIPTGLQFWRRKDLLAKIGRGIENHPVRAISAHSNRGLHAPLRCRFTCPGSLAYRTIAVPLRKAAARPRSQHLDNHHRLAPQADVNSCRV